MPEKQSRRSFLAAAGTGAVAALAGCGGGGDDDDTTTTTTSPSDDDTTTTTTTQSGGTLQMAATGPVQSLDSINAKGSGAGYPQYNLQLFQFPNGSFPPEGALVESYDVSDDGLTYTFNLMQGVEFHDGQEFTAADAVFSFARMAQSDNSRNRDDIIGETMMVAHTRETDSGTVRLEGETSPPDGTSPTDIVPGSLAVEAVDEYTFRMELNFPFQWTLYQIAGGAFAIIPENSVGDIERDDIETSGEYGYNEFFGTANGGPQHAGLGPFKINSWQKGSELALTAHENYHLEGPELDGVTYTVITSGNTRLQRFQGGNLDILEGMPSASFNPDSVTIEEEPGDKEIGTYQLSNGETVNFGRIPVLTTEYLVFNCQRVIRPARVAIAYLLNQQRVARDAYKGIADPAYHISPPAVYPTFEDGVSTSESYDRHAQDGYMSNTDFGADGYPYGYGESLFDEAAQVMEDAGYGPNNQYSFTATTITGDDAYGNVMTTLQEKARQAHINMEITEADFGTIISQAINGEMDMFALGDGMEYPSPSNFLRFLWGNVSPFQFTRWGGPDSRDGGESHYVDEYWQTAMNAWQENYDGHQGGGEQNRLSRFEAYQTIEEMNWASVQELPTVHAIDQRFWHQDVDVDMYGVMANQKFDSVTKG